MTSTHRLPSMHRHLTALGFCALFTLTSSATASALPDDPFDGTADPMAMVPVNHTDRYAINIFVDKYWAGDVNEHSGGGKAACCFPGLEDWREPVTVSWRWGTESDPVTKAITLPPESRTSVTHFPANGPDPARDDHYICVIFHDLDTVELAFSPTRRACTSKSRSERKVP